MSIIKRLYSRNFFIINLVLVGVIIGFGLAYTGFSRPPAGQPSASIQAESPVAQAPADVKAAIATAEAVQNAFRYVADRVQPAVVEINVVETATDQSGPNDQVPPFFFKAPDQGQDQNPNPQQFQERGLGSGIIVRRDGKTVYVLTNNHVAGSATEITVTTHDGKEYKASLVGKDERKDLALVKFSSDSASIAVATLGDSSALRVGDWAIAIGNPFGLVSSVTAGIVSAIGRTGSDLGPSGAPDGNISDFIQTDASINKGNSGGALVNIRGEVVGINTWIASPTGGSIGLGFAIPINNAKRAIDDFITKGKVSYGWLGVSLRDIDKATAAELGVDPKAGAFAAHVFRDSPADKGGFLPGDYVTRVNGQDVTGLDQLVRIVGDLSAGRRADFVVKRGGADVKLSVVIEPRKDAVAANDGNVYPGLDVVSLKSEDIDQTKLPKGVSGVVVVNVIPKSPAATIGVKPGDIITQVNETAISTVRDFYRLINDPAAAKVAFTVNRDGTSVTTLAYVRK
ncbi:MAG TPA: Do family serine endopeptidase [Rectinemataceae bacterium]|nr:Do family serine endopeptidase [Rectinemataceae bacterium]